MSLPSQELSDNELLHISTEFQRINSQHYLDHAGATLYSEKQIDEISTTLKANLYCNPHTSRATGDLIDQVRYRILKHFNVDTTQYSVIFTSGATASLKLIGESFNFGLSGSFFYVQENHTSVLGMRDIVNTEKVFVLTREQLLKNSNEIYPAKDNISESKDSSSLVTFSAQCNFSGFKYPLDLISKIQENGLTEVGKPLRDKTLDFKSESNWYICLDAACFASTNFLDLKKYQPDFVCISFYKIFGFPTGLGALFVSNRGQKVLSKNYYGGGTVKIAMSGVDFNEKRDIFHERFEDGTISFLSIASLLSGFHTIERLVTPTKNMNSMERIGKHVYELAKYCYESLENLHYENQNPLVKLYNHTNFCSVNSQGGIVVFNLMHDDGRFVGFAEVACLASMYNIHLRTGCFCNPGACQMWLKLTDEEVNNHYKLGHICGDYNDLINGVPTGAVRVSFGYMSKKSDVDVLVNMLKECYTKNIDTRINLLHKTNIPPIFKHIPKRYKKNLNKLALRQICIYPIKSCGAFRITDKWELTEKGLKFDRCWMVVNSNGMAITQKSMPKLCLISPQIDIFKDVMSLNFPEKDPLEIPLRMNSNKIIKSSFCQSKVCGDMIEGIDCGDKVAGWLSDCLSLDGIRLIHQNDETERRNNNGSVKDLNLSNQAQFLLINYTSVTWLASKVDSWTDIDSNYIEDIVDRFRANLIIQTTEPLEELQFKTIQIGDNTFKVEGPCTRCQMICIDQKTSLKTPELLRTIAREFQGKIRFGIYLSQIAKDSRINFISCQDHIKVH